MLNFFKKSQIDDEIPAPEEPISPLNEADIVINGLMRGSVQGRCDVVVDVKGHCVGSFVVKDLDIYGTVIGDVCADELIIHPTGQLYFRNVFAQNTTIHDGGVYTGHRDLLDAAEVEDLDVEARETAKDKSKNKAPLDTPKQEKVPERKKKGPTFISTY